MKNLDKSTSKILLNLKAYFLYRIKYKGNWTNYKVWNIKISNDFEVYVATGLIYHLIRKSKSISIFYSRSLKVEKLVTTFDYFMIHTLFDLLLGECISLLFFNTFNTFNSYCWEFWKYIMKNIIKLLKKCKCNVKIKYLSFHFIQKNNWNNLMLENNGKIIDMKSQ